MGKIRGGSALLFLLVGACATAEGRREDNAPIVRTTPKTFAVFQSCFASHQEARLSPPTYTPKEHGGTFTNNTSSTGLSLYVVDITDMGSQREVRLYAKGGMYGSQKQVLGVIEQCL